jgi:hypothetical protein
MIIKKKSSWWKRIWQFTYDFERTPVPVKEFKGLGENVGALISAHCAATELIFGATFVLSGVTLKEYWVAAPISIIIMIAFWSLLTGRLAIQTRLNPFWYGRRVLGFTGVKIYQALAWVAYMAWTGIGITIVSKAISLITGWNYLVLAIMLAFIVGLVSAIGWRALTTIGVILGFWIVPVFMIFALRALAGLNWDFSVVFTGNVAPGFTEMSCWDIVFVITSINVLEFGGCADMDWQRYAKNLKEATIPPAVAMSISHATLWFMSAIMCAAIGFVLDPGLMGWSIAGGLGLLFVFLAGFTTQAFNSYNGFMAGYELAEGKIPRWAIAFVSMGIALFFVEIGLLDNILIFVEFLGATFASIGAIFAADRWMLPKLGIQNEIPYKTGKKVYIPALIAYASGTAFAVIQTAFLELFKSFYIGWIFSWMNAMWVAMLVYVILAKVLNPPESSEVVGG